MGDAQTTEETPATWEESDERKVTWVGDLTVDSITREAVLTITTTTETQFRIRIPRRKIEGMVRDLDWAKDRLDPWPEHYPVDGKAKGDDD